MTRASLGAAGLGQALHDDTEHARRNGKIVQRARCCAQRLSETLVRRRILIVATDVLKLRRQFRERVGIESAVLLHTVARPVTQLVQRPSRPSHADDGHVQLARADQGLQRGKDLLESQIAGGTEENKGIRAFGHCHRSTLSRPETTAPPRQRGKTLPNRMSAAQDSSANRPAPLSALLHHALFSRAELHFPLRARPFIFARRQKACCAARPFSFRPAHA